jgi:ABC-type phosphate transport system substrate-binding protein
MDNRKAFPLMALAAALCSSLPAFADVVVIVNPKNPVSSLTAQQVAQIYLGRAGVFPSGGAVTPLDLKEGASARDDFYTKVAEKTPGQLKAYRARQMFSGNGAPPREIASDADMRKAVASDPTAIGYIDRSALDGTVKQVLTVR